MTVSRSVCILLLLSGQLCVSSLCAWKHVCLCINWMQIECMFSLILKMCMAI